ncbi:MAG: CBS domain-containing protein [Rikenellaceae bacterium]|nr:CBS domain-containing protein [Rikenellaceae bacterium]
MEPPSSNLTDDYFSLGILLILILFSYFLLKGTEVALLNSGNKSKDRESHQCAIMQSSLLLKLSALITVIVIFNLLIGGTLSRFLLFTLSFLTTIVLLTVCGYALYKTTSANKHEMFLKRSRWFFSAVIWFGRPLNLLLEHIMVRYGKVTDEMTAQSIEEMPEVEEKLLLKGIVGLQSKSVNEIMTPRINVASLDVSMSSGEVIEKAIECGFSRLPVYDSSPDKVVGFLYVKDLVSHLRDKEYDFNWRMYIRKSYFVPGSKKIDDLLEEFRQKRMHLAVVADEYGGTEGIVTLEDILEEIVGEISDESDVL